MAGFFVNKGMPEIINMNLQQRQTVLMERITKIAEIFAPEIGYIVCGEINHLVDTEMLREATILTTKLFLKNISDLERPEKVLGVPNRGKEFATALGIYKASGIKQIAVTERFREEKNINHELQATYNEETDMINITGIPSFTNEKSFYTHKIRGLRPGDNVLVADDFCAYGHVSQAYYKALKPLGIKTFFSFLVAKDFKNINPPQTGYQKLLDAKIPAFALVRFTDIQNGKVIAEIGKPSIWI